MFKVRYLTADHDAVGPMHRSIGVDTVLQLTKTRAAVTFLAAARGATTILCKLLDAKDKLLPESVNDS